MLNLKGSRKTIELIKFLQTKNKEMDSDYVPKSFFEPNKSALRKVWDFCNPFYHQY